MKPTGTMKHIGITRRLLMILCESDWRNVVPEAHSKEEALAVVRAIPTPVYSDCDCPKEADGSCAGIPSSTKEG